MPRGLLSFLAFDSVWRAAPFLHFGLQSLQNRGYAAFGATTLKDQQFTTTYGNGPLSLRPRPFTYRLQGNQAVATITSQPRSAQPFVVSEPTSLSIAFDGINPQSFAQTLSRELAGGSPMGAVAATMERAQAPFAFIAMTTKGETLAGRDQTGRLPLSIGNMGFDSGTVISTESPAIDVIGGENGTPINPGEAYFITPNSIERKQVKGDEAKFCAMEYAYLARPDSILDLGEVCRIRGVLGGELAKESALDGASVVVSVPQSSSSQAQGYSQCTNTPYAEGFVENVCMARNLLEKDHMARISVAQLKLNPIGSSVRDRKVAIIDNLVVRGTTLKCAAQRLRGHGARSVHALISSPPVTAPCPYSDLLPSRKELISARLKEEEIEKVLGLDTIRWLSIGGMVRALKAPQERLCMECFRGEMK